MPAFTSHEYIYDSGVSDNALGLNNGTSLAWIHHFDRVGGAETLTAISTVFGTPAFPGSCGCSLGQDFQVHVWSDPNGDGDPSDAVLLASAADLISVPVESDVFQTTPIGPVALPESFFIGAATQGNFPAAVDGTIENLDAWFDFNDPDVYDPNLINATNLDTVIPGVWLLRADASGDGGDGGGNVPSTTGIGVALMILLLGGGSAYFLRRK